LGDAGVAPTAAVARRPRAPTRDRAPRSRLRGKSNVLTGGAMVLIAIVVAIHPSFVSGQDPIAQDIGNRLLPPMWMAGGQAQWPLGTDQLGRDVLSRLAHGARISLTVGFCSILIGGPIGLALGLIAGYRGGIADAVVMRLVDLHLAFPFLLLAMALIAILGAGVWKMVLIFALTSWMLYARTVRASVLSLREREFVQGARAIGAGGVAIVARHILPNAVNPLIVLLSFDVARIILTESALSFLGLGAPPPAPSWGSMLSEGREYIEDAWWIAAFPGLAIMVVTVGVSVLGNGLRDLLDPNFEPLTDRTRGGDGGTSDT